MATLSNGKVVICLIQNTKHPFTQVQITDKGLEEMAKIVENVRNMVGYDIPLSTDHFGHFDLNNGIRLGRALEKYRLAWMEDIVSWELTRPVENFV